MCVNQWSLVLWPCGCVTSMGGCPPPPLRFNQTMIAGPKTRSAHKGLEGLVAGCAEQRERRQLRQASEVARAGEELLGGEGRAVTGGFCVWACFRPLTTHCSGWDAPYAGLDSGMCFRLACAKLCVRPSQGGDSADSLGNSGGKQIWNKVCWDMLVCVTIAGPWSVGAMGQTTVRSKALELCSA